MKYTEVTLHINPLDPFKDLMVYALGEEGPYDSFSDTPDGMKAYVPSHLYDEAFLQQAVAEAGCQISYEVNEMPDKNWNEVWEASHQPVLVENFCWVRAPFHPHRDDVEYEIEIEPKMSFGTAHHATTYMMLSWLRDEAVAHKRVLDMGSGTAVLAILAAKKGADYVEAVDVDEWAYRNALENIERNGVPQIHCVLGDASCLTNDKHFDLILANINRNILLRDLQHYAKVLNVGGTILLSGFYEHDVAKIQEEAERQCLTLAGKRVRDEWCSLKLTKEYNLKK